MIVVYVESSLLKGIREGKMTDIDDDSTSASACSVQKSNPLNDVISHKGRVCEKSFVSLSVLKQHYMNHIDEKPNLLSNARNHKCHICGKAEATLGKLKQHYMIHTREKPFECDICGKGFNKKSVLTTHVLIHRPKKSPTQVQKCVECGKDFKTYSGLFRHNRNHHIGNDKLPKCDLCDKVFTENSSLKQHYLIHTGEKTFPCENCGKRFNKKSSLVKHFKTHDSSETLNCSECGKVFKSVSGLSKHKRVIHRYKVKVYACEICDKEFDYGFQLKQHCLTHTGEKPFECDICEKRYAIKDSFVKHMAAHKTKTVQNS